MFSTAHNKRPATYQESDHTLKKRAPYAARACEVCKRRKSKCSGSEPCAYCEERSLRCEYVTTKPAHYQGVMGISRESEASASRLLATPAPSVDSSGRDSVSVTTSRSRPGEVRTLGNETGLSNLHDLVSSLQEQVISLTSQLDRVGREGTRRELRSVSVDKPTQRANAGPYLDEMLVRPSVDHDQASAEAMPTGSRKRFHGPTSPEYSLHVAKRQMQMQGLQRGGIRSSTMDVSQSSTEDRNDYGEDASEDEIDESGTTGVPSITSHAQIPWNTLLEFRQLLTKHATVRLIHTYQQVFGDLHPMVDIGIYVRLVESLYDQRFDYDDHNKPCSNRPEITRLLILNLILAIALSTEHNENRHVGQNIFSLCRTIVHLVVIPSAATLESVIIGLLVGTYYFFKDDPQLAWRMCGLAGNMLLELGLHIPKFVDRSHKTHHEQTEVAAVIGTTIILDRQWSAATGLPTHFQESYFHADMRSPIQAPYLRAMVAFMSVSDKFTCPIARIASTGQAYEEDAEFESLKSEIEQWREIAVGIFDFTNKENSDSQSIRNIPSWAILLNFRANNAHNMLMRPFFFTNKLTPGSRKHVEPAIRLISETISILSSLDQMTDDYRKQLPFYVHVLISACALMSLVSSHVAQNFSAVRDDLPEDFAEMMKRNYDNASSLASAYQRHSRASRKLVKQLEILRPTLVRLNVLPKRHPRESSPGETWHHDLCHHQRKSRQNISTLQLDTSQTYLHIEANDQMAARQTQPNSNREECSSVHEMGLESTGSFLVKPKDIASSYESAQNDSINHDLYHVDDLISNGFYAGMGNFESAITPLQFGQDTNASQDWSMASGQTFFSEGELMNYRHSGWQ